MSDENQAPEADTPDTQTDEPTVNWEERYQNLQPEYTRASQEAARYRGLVERAREGDPEAARELGFEFAEEDDEYDDTPDAEPGESQADYDRRIAALEQRDEARERETALAAIETHVERELAALKDLDESDHDLVIELAVQKADENGMPDVKGAYERLIARDTQAQKRWAKSKTAPHVDPSGQAATDAPDISQMSDQARREHMRQRLMTVSE